MADENSEMRIPRPGSTTASDEAARMVNSDAQEGAGKGSASASSSTHAGIGNDNPGNADLKGGGSRMADEVKNYADEMTGRAKEQGRSMFEEQKEGVAAQADSVAHAFRSTANKLQREDKSPAG